MICVNCGKRTVIDAEGICMVCGKPGREIRKALSPVGDDDKSKDKRRRRQGPRQETIPEISSLNRGIPKTFRPEIVTKPAEIVIEEPPIETKPAKPTNPTGINQHTIPPKPEGHAPILVHLYYVANAEAILKDYHVIGDLATRRKWKFAPKAWLNFRRDHNLPKPPACRGPYTFGVWKSTRPAVFTITGEDFNGLTIAEFDALWKTLGKILVNRLQAIAYTGHDIDKIGKSLHQDDAK